MKKLQTEKKDKSTTIRDLVELGRVHFAVMQYSENKISMGKASEIAGISISEMMDLLEKLGVKSNLDLSDYFESRKHAKKIFG